MSTLQSLQDALAKDGNNEKKRNLLLGNGFSRACRNDLFAYDALFEKAKERLSPRAMLAFKTLDTTDFERVMRALKQAKSLVSAYASEHSVLSDWFDCDANSLREVLASVIAANHPERANQIPDAEFKYCRAFLRNFKRIYTLNYDLLLYWALMKKDADEWSLNCDDGFRQPDEGPEEYVVWDYSDRGQQSLFYMHGALHIFDAGAEVQKYTWSNTGIALVDQIRGALEEERYPIYVSEGTSSSKLDRVMHSSYLIRGYRSLAEISGSLFVFGLSFHENDAHILKCIEEGNVRNIYISIFGNPKSPDNQAIMGRAESLRQRRLRSRRRNPPDLSVGFYDAASASVWG